LSNTRRWVDQMHLPTGVWGEFRQGVWIDEENRASVFEFRKEGIQLLLKICRDNYTRKNVRAIVFGVQHDGPETKYAIFVERKFLRPVSEDE
jgi:hypothetical protein